MSNSHHSVNQEWLSVAKGETSLESASTCLIQKKGLDQSSVTDIKRIKQIKKKKRKTTGFWNFSFHWTPISTLILHWDRNSSKLDQHKNLISMCF